MMEGPGRDASDASEAAWAAVLLRSVAHLADRLPEEPIDDGRGRRPVFDYGPDAAEDDDAYQNWVARWADARKRQRAMNRRAVAHRRDIPRLSVVIAGDGPRRELDEKTWDSARDQDLPDVDIVAGPELGLALAERWNRGVAQSGGDFLAFVEAGDELEPGVLADIALALGDEPEADFLYTDSDSLDPGGRRARPFFKPGWSPDQLLSHMYIGRLMVVRRSLFQAAGGFRCGLEGGHEHDLALRVTERARRVIRLPIVAYHRRTVNPVNDEATMLVLEDALRRRGDNGTVEPGLSPGTYRVRRPIHGEPLVSVVVPFHNGSEHLRRCLRALHETAGYDRWEAVLVDNRSWDPNTRALAARIERDPRVRLLSYPGPFNWAAINNYAATHSAGSHLLFMNVDVEGRSDGWMTAMLEHSQRGEIGAVGARLLYPDGRVQHAGVVLGLGAGIAWHAFCYCPQGSSGYFDQAKVIRNYSAVTGACLMVRREVFERLGGFAEDLPVAYNDVDFCLRLQDHGYRVVYTPFAELVHDESQTRGRTPPDPSAVDMMTARWGSRIRRDPYYNPNLDLRRPEGALSRGEGPDDR